MKANYLPHLAGRVFGVPLLIQPQKLSVILQAIGPRLGLPAGEIEVQGLGMPVVARMPMEEDDPDEMDDASRGQKPYLVTPEGIAVIGVSGTLVKKASWLDAVSGLQSYESIRADFQDAVSDPRIQGILLDVDSPGGEVGGLFDLADEIYNARTEKPCFAIADDDAFSAAYAIASSAQRLFVTRTGGVGSVGVIALHMDQSGFDEKAGRKYTAIYAGARKNDFNPHESLSAPAKDELQAEIDRLYDMFVGTVARNREMKPTLVRNTEAGLYYAEKAVSAGLADQVGTFDDALNAVLEAVTARKQARVAASAATQIPNKEMDMSTAPETKADAAQTTTAAAPEVKPPEAPASTPAAPEAPALDAAAIETRLRAEYEEIAALCSLASRPELAAEMIASKRTVAQVREHLLSLKAQESQRTAVQSHVQAGPTGAEAQLNTAAQQLAASRNIPFAQAYVEAMKLHPELYQQYLAEKSATVRPN
ncbi:MAG: S49 family peptidase [Bryobacteraceae bacterium]|nr:S49 family peptidase [Bryobacteraceae bacterium]